MMFSWPAFGTTVGAVIVSGIVATFEGTATNRRVTMGFLNHGGMWGDLIFMSTVTGLVFPYLVRTWGAVILAVTVSVAVSLIAHAGWATAMNNEGVTGHMFPMHGTGEWYLDISTSGWIHVLVMSSLLALMLLYIVSPVPARIAVITSFLLTVHVFLATVQPGWCCTRKLWTWRNLAPPFITTVLIWAVAVLKARFAFPSV